MEFWIGLVIFCLICILFERFLPQHINNVMPYVLLFVLWFISAFRYMIGWDYESYISLFSLVEYGDVYPELSFIIIAAFFRNIGFDYQSIFVFYSTLTFLFLWAGLKYYLNTSREILLALLLFLVSTDLYFNSFSIIRQFLAVSIMFYASQYIIKKRILIYICWTVFAAFWHYSAIVLIPLYYINDKFYMKRTYVLILIFGILVSLLNIIPNIFISCTDLIFSNYATYMLSDEKVGFLNGVSGAFSVITMLSIFCFYKNQNKNLKMNFLLNSYFLYILILLLFYFSLPLLRLKLYFSIFFPILFSKMFYSLNNKLIKIFLGVLILGTIVIFFYHINSLPKSIDGILHPYFSANNVEFNFNFKLIK